MGSSIVGAPATDLAARVRDGELSARQTVASHLDHLERVEPRLHAYVSVRRDQALAEAEELDGRGDLADLPLAGVPVAVKDNLDVAGVPTRHGSLATADHPAPTDDVVVARLRLAGAVPIGKTRCPELCLWGTSDTPDGAAVSPWDPSRTAGGSSGGSAAAVAGGTAPVAVASDGLGSVRIPAAACGLTGIKPGADLLPELVDGEHHWFGMSRHGPLATTVADAALMLDVMAGTDRHRDVAPPDRPLRVAVSLRPHSPGFSIHDAWIDAALEAGRLLRHVGHDVTRAEPPVDARTVNAVTARWFQGAARDVEQLVVDEAALEPRTRRHAAMGRRLAALAPVDPVQAERAREPILEFLTQHDVLVCPTLAHHALPVGPWHNRSWSVNVFANLRAYHTLGLWNLVDLPVAAVPLGMDRGRPLSVQVIAATGREDLVLSVAAQLESLVPWVRHAPGWEIPDSGR